jgi:hypothetical protein
MIMLLLVLKLIVSSHPLNFEAARAFMFCYTNSGKRDSTMLYYGHYNLVADYKFHTMNS